MSANKPTPFLPSTRREFFNLSAKGLGLLAFSRFAPNFLVQSTLAQTPAPEKDRSILVLVQLAGGNDGLNTLIPFEDADYYRLRPTLGIAKEKVLRASDTMGLHPAMTSLHGLLHDGKLAIVQNVGYPNPNRSHFRSTEIWETATDSDKISATGWIGRYLDNACTGIPAGDHD
ncbi:MAG TPA: twin-arginine translocation pathway signal protein, partial [Opitutaceae bacterium]|nr:twin-arginine translocation pathway signal protein [Opitutaceae bacterium]